MPLAERLIAAIAVIVRGRPATALPAVIAETMARPVIRLSAELRRIMAAVCFDTAAAI